MRPHTFEVAGYRDRGPTPILCAPPCTTLPTHSYKSNFRHLPEYSHVFTAEDDITVLALSSTTPLLGHASAPYAAAAVRRVLRDDVGTAFGYAIDAPTVVHYAHCSVVASIVPRGAKVTESNAATSLSSELGRPLGFLPSVYLVAVNGTNAHW